MPAIVKFPPINPKCPHLLHGGDYNPDQWQHMPEILREDIRLMKVAGCNAMSVGIFSWAHIEPEEGCYDFGWLDRTMDDFAEAGLYAVLATPSGARPAWMAQKYPEVLRVTEARQRRLFGERHNHCLTSPVYREKCRAINGLLAERYKNHPALLVWHVSNEYGGDCHCDLCQNEFRQWLQARYGTLDALNQAWWTSFWSHTYGDWSQIESPSSIGEKLTHALTLDWKRFVTAQTADFLRNELGPLKEITPDIPVTTNFVTMSEDLDYWKIARELDVISWDAYPEWGQPHGDWNEAANVSFLHDMHRSMKSGKPFMLMESTPSMVNWMRVCKPKRPGVHRLASLQAVAHGSDTVQYFQWRKSRGAVEKFHGAVVDHCNHEHTRVFRDVAEVGRALSHLDDVVGTTVSAEVAVIFDWENRWAVNDAWGPRRPIGYEGTCHVHYRPFWRRGIPVDVIDADVDFSGYRLLVAPMLYMVRPGVAERMEAFVAAGGTLVATYWSGIVNESDLCFLGGFPGPLRRLLGIWSEEMDALYDEERNSVEAEPGNTLGLCGGYAARELCDLIHVETATVAARYGNDFYRGRPALTENAFGLGSAIYVASRNDERFCEDLVSGLVRRLGLKPVLETDLPSGVTAQRRSNGKEDFVFLMNFHHDARRVDLGAEEFLDVLEGGLVRERVEIEGFGARVLRRKAR